MVELHKASCCEESYSSAGLPSIARESFRVRLWLPYINLGLEKARADCQSDVAGSLATQQVSDSIETTGDIAVCNGREWVNRVLKFALMEAHDGLGMQPGRAEASRNNPRKLAARPSRTL
jgi:hypothetical protein